MTRNSGTLAVWLCSVVLLACQCDETPPTGPGADAGPVKTADAAVAADADSTTALPLPESAVPIEARATARDKAAMDGLKATMGRGAFLWGERSRKANAPHFLYMAATETDPAIIAAALQAMAKSWSHDPRQTTKAPINADYRAVVRARLSHEDKRVLGRAMEASRNILAEKNPDPEVIATLAKVIVEHEAPAARYSALVALIQLRDIHTNKDAAQALLSALDDEAPHIASTALRVLQFIAYSLEDRTPYITKTLALFDHEDPGVRGRALLVSTSLAQGKTPPGQLAAKILPKLEDPHAYTRSAAAASLAALGHKAAIHKLITMIGDKAPNSYTLKGFKTLAGDSATVSHSGSAWSRVDDAAMNAIQILTADMGEEAFKIGAIKPKSVDQDLARANRDVRRWYSTHKGKLPKP